VWEASIKHFFDAYAKSTPCRPVIINDYAFSSADAVESSVPTTRPELLYQSMEIASVVLPFTHPHP
jgi:hypothetical protein